MATEFEKWQQTIDAALKDPAWDGYDCDIQRIVNEFNTFLARTHGFALLDWKLIKAMVWTESGGPSTPAWNTRPIQIGNPGDPGLRALLSGQEGGELILPAPYAKSLTIASAVATPQMNIVAGVAYLLMRCARYGNETVTSGPVTPYTVLPGDSFDKIARLNGSTVDALQKLNPGVRLLHPKQVLKFQKAVHRKQITGWERITTALIAAKYNTGDPRYVDKLNYCLAVIQKVSGRTKC